MSVSVDDLVASFNSTHVGQDQIDLAALQIELSQTLFAQGLPLNDRDVGYAGQPCNTPTACTPSSPGAAFGGWVPIMDVRKSRSSSLAGRQSHSQSCPSVEEVAEYDDERIVEDMLGPPEPSSSHLHPAAHSQAFPTSAPLDVTAAYAYEPFGTTSFNSSASGAAASSVFASTDPFFLAAQAPAPPRAPSLFAQAGRPAHTSPFIIQQPPASRPIASQQAAHAHFHAAPMQMYAEPMER